MHATLRATPDSDRGGHIRASPPGNRRTRDDGGNITVEKLAIGRRRTGGSRSISGSAGSVNAETGGGGVRVRYSSGPMDVETSGGGIS